jgi:hypothetical protein
MIAIFVAGTFLGRDRMRPQHGIGIRTFLGWCRVVLALTKRVAMGEVSRDGVWTHSDRVSVIRVAGRDVTYSDLVAALAIVIVGLRSLRRERHNGQGCYCSDCSLVHFCLSFYQILGMIGAQRLVCLTALLGHRCRDRS